MDTITYNDNEKYTKGKICLDQLVSEHDKQIKKELIEKACEWLEDRLTNYTYDDPLYQQYINTRRVTDDFKKAMMEEEK